jgi:hypothetical protein
MTLEDLANIGWNLVDDANIESTEPDSAYEKSTNFQSLVRKIMQSISTTMENNSNRVRREFSKILKEARHKK